MQDKNEQRRKWNWIFLYNTIQLEESIRVLITNNHVLNENVVLPRNIINFSTNDDNNFDQILIDESRLIYTNYDYDITIIQLKEEDNIDNISFFDIYEQIFEINLEQYKNKEIYLLYYPKGKK